MFVTTVNDVFLLLGSNLGNRQMYLSEAVRRIGHEIAPVIRTSSLYETQAWGKTDEPDYLNQVAELKTDLPPKEILKQILNIEKAMGRKREEKWGSRIIDIDVLFYDSLVISGPELTIPHPEMHKRRFTLEPLNELIPDFVHPVLGKTVAELKNELNDGLLVKKL
ncbi:MAG TPA: 2-amino-4-hydroxy-6-hydroxymethyldihydropteridine diphosphokinase [Mucilaginibacter sp.]|nr:2-amino-4-hydroxy-6-hydroxymethyldihydropteridine diphosphokinase [Mucilaginibacter sp.]